MVFTSSASHTLISLMPMKFFKWWWEPFPCLHSLFFSSPERTFNEKRLFIPLNLFSNFTDISEREAIWQMAIFGNRHIQNVWKENLFGEYFLVQLVKSCYSWRFSWTHLLSSLKLHFKDGQAHSVLVFETWRVEDRQLLKSWKWKWKM